MKGAIDGPGAMNKAVGHHKNVALKVLRPIAVKERETGHLPITICHYKEYPVPKRIRVAIRICKNNVNAIDCGPVAGFYGRKVDSNRDRPVRHCKVLWSIAIVKNKSSSKKKGKVVHCDWKE